jgi:hypothetical protein
MLGAYAELAAIAQALGAKDALKKFGKAIRSKGAEGDPMAELRRKLAPMIQRGLVKER